MRRWAVLAILTTRKVIPVAALRPPSLTAARYALEGGGLATGRAICVVERCAESSRTFSTLRFLCSVRLAAHPARYALEGGVGKPKDAVVRLAEGDMA